MIKKTGLLLLGTILTLLALVILNLNSRPVENEETLAKTVYHPEKITLESRAVAAYTPQLIAPYKSMDVFVSEEQKSDFSFTSVGGYWQEKKPSGTNVEVQVRFKMDDAWTEWVDLEEEVENENGDVAKKFAVVSTNEAQSFQYKVFMYGDGNSIPSIENVEWTFIKSGKNLTPSKNPVPQYSATNASPSGSSYLALASTVSGVTSRSSWGADESYRYLENNDEEAELIKLDEDWYDKYADELGYSRVVEEDSFGDKYKWPLQYPKKVTKIIVHHTATTGNLDNPSQAIRDIYYYHAITRGWGDIGYNYIIDPKGKIYEGRFGGEGVIGAHAGPGNHGSIGISILGNYEESEVPESVIVSLSDFIAQKAKIHNIAPNANSYFRGEIMPNIFGHKDIMATTCPGAFLYEKLPLLRILSADAMTEEKEKFVKDYDYQDQSDVYYLELKPDEIKDVTIEMENIGLKSWGEGTFLVANSDDAFSGVISFPDSQESYLAAEMEEASVKSGGMATFKFQIKGGKQGETVYLKLTPVINGTNKLSGYKILPVSVQQTSFKYEFIDAHYPEELMRPGEEFIAWVKLENKGNITWTNKGDNKVVLKTDHERGRISKFISPNGTTLGYLENKEVKPGETGKFILNLVAPESAGHFQEYFTPYVVNEDIYMADSGMYFETTIYGGQYGAEIEGITPGTTWEPGQKYLLWIRMRNLGETAWTEDNLSLSIMKHNDISVEDATLSKEEIKPGEVGTVYFVVKVGENLTLGKKSMIIRPRVDSHNLLKKPITLKYEIVESEDSVEQEPKEDFGETELDYDEGDIRVKISFEGNPEISGDDEYTIYSANKEVVKASADEISEVVYEDGQYQVTVNGTTYKKSSPLRFMPGDDTILRIDNYENRPAWNTKLNYNEYRGILEVRQVDSELVVINELPLEDYLKGLGEVSNTELTEKIKAIMIAARTYAMYYIEIGTKFPGKPYDLEDDPNTSQKYIGYSFEKLTPNISAAIDKTRGQVVTYEGELVKTPYFNQSDGTYTKSAKEVWNWDAGFLVSVSDSYCDGDEFRGHGVGMSGCGAHGMAEAGYSYTEILHHYYTDIEIVDLY